MILGKEDSEERGIQGGPWGGDDGKFSLYNYRGARGGGVPTSV